MSQHEACAEIKTRRLLLRKVCLDDAADLTDLISNWNVIQWLSEPPYPYHMSDARAFIERTQAEQMSFGKDNLTRAIDVNGLLAGMISYKRGDCGSSLGYWLGEPFWHQGYMTEAVNAVLGHYFCFPDNNEMVSCVLVGNHGSLRIQQAFGFEITGEAQLYCASHGAVKPSLCTRLTRQRYEAGVK